MSCHDLCVDMYCDGDACSFISEAVRCARKKYVCCECRAQIAPGERYHYVAGKSDGEMFAERTCLSCGEIRRAFVCGGYMVGQLWDSIREQLFPRWDEMKAIDCLAKLTTDAAIAKMRGEYTRFRGERKA